MHCIINKANSLGKLKTLQGACFFAITCLKKKDVQRKKKMYFSHRENSKKKSLFRSERKPMRKTKEGSMVLTNPFFLQ